jgi:hypothetical protein
MDARQSSDSSSDWVLVKTRSGRPSAAAYLTPAQRSDWQAWMEANPSQGSEEWPGFTLLHPLN